MANKSKQPRWAAHHRARLVADKRLLELPNVRGTCFGFKSSSTPGRDPACFTVFVSKKVPLKKLHPRHRIPETVRRHGVDLKTDVIVVDELRKELGFAIGDGTQIGTLGCFGANGGNLYGITCAHCVGGPDGNSGTPDPITIEFPMRGNYLALGMSGVAAASNGAGVFPNFGNFDAATVDVSTPVVMQYVQSRSMLPVFRPDRNLLVGNALSNAMQYIPVAGWGAGTNNIIRGRIGGMFVNMPPYLFDVMIEDPTGSGLTRPGDSGMIWSDPSGQAIGLHMIGDATGPNGSSLRSFACFAFRVADTFGATLITA